jgi:hypothetical protein
MGGTRSTLGRFKKWAQKFGRKAGEEETIQKT